MGLVFVWEVRLAAGELVLGPKDSSARIAQIRKSLTPPSGSQLNNWVGPPGSRTSSRFGPQADRKHVAGLDPPKVADSSQGCTPASAMDLLESRPGPRVSVMQPFWRTMHGWCFLFGSARGSKADPGWILPSGEKAPRTAVRPTSELPPGHGELDRLGLDPPAFSFGGQLC